MPLTLPTRSPYMFEVTLPVRGTLYLSQARGPALVADVADLVVSFDPGREPLVRVGGYWAPQERGGPSMTGPRAIQMRNGRPLSDLEATNPGVTAALRREYPALPWPAA